MPHGGRRPGAGAPKGNINGVKHGRNHQRAELCIHIYRALPPRARRALDDELAGAGIIPRDGTLSRRDGRRLTVHLLARWFGRERGSQSCALQPGDKDRGLAILRAAHQHEDAQSQLESADAPALAKNEMQSSNQVASSPALPGKGPALWRAAFGGRVRSGGGEK